MNRRLFALTIKGIVRRFKTTTKVSLAVIFSFLFVTGILLLQENMYNWQMVKAKEHFGNWFVMYESAYNTENESFSNFSYLEKSVSATAVNEIYDKNSESMGIRIGTMSDAFIKTNNITVEQGKFPANDNEIAADWNTLLTLNQGYEIGDEITLIFKNLDTESGYETRTYTLSGILTSYTSVWVNGSAVPGVLVTETEAESVKFKKSTIYTYPLKSYIREDNYRLIYDRLCENAGVKNVGSYNESVYEITPWGNQVIYRYMYVLMMVIGVASICYQLLSYNRDRAPARKIQKQLGATSTQIFSIYMVENAFIIVVSAAVGVAISVALGAVICNHILNDGSINFYTVSAGTILKSVITLLIAIVFSGFVYIFTNRSRKTKNIRIKNVKKNITHKNIVWQTSSRFIRNNGFLVNFFVRAFGLAMAVVMVFCAVSAMAAFRDYAENNASVDIVGYSKEDVSTSYYFYYQVASEKYEDYFMNMSSTGAVENYLRGKSDADEPFNYYYLRQIEMNRKIKCGLTDVTSGLSDNALRDIQNVDGVENILASYYETTRSWNWESMDLNKLNADDYYTLSGNNITNNGKYLFASEYVDFTEDIAGLIKQSTGADVSLSDLQSGKSAVIFVDANTKGVYDDTITVGTTINLDSLFTYVTRISSYGTDDEESVYSKAVYQAVYDYIYSDSGETSMHNYELLEDYWIPTLSKEEVVELLSSYSNDLSNFVSLADEAQVHEFADKLKNNEITLDDLYDYVSATYGGMYEEKPYKRIVTLLYFNKMMEMYYSPAATTKAAVVVQLTDEIKEAFREIIPEFGQYTMLASSNLLSEALDSQNEMMKAFLRVDTLPESVELKMNPTQVAVTYGLSSTFTSTNNIVAAYLNQSGFTYNSYSEQKDQLKEKTVEAILLYGFSGLASLVIYILISLVILMNRLEKNRTSLDILAKTGASRSVRVKICMIECLRESLWCIVVFPLSVVIGYLTVRSRV